MSTKDIRVELTVQLPAENRPSHIVFQYVAAGAGEQDYLVAVRHQATPRQGDADDADLSNLPDRKQPTASFSPVLHPRADSALRRPGSAQESSCAGRCGQRVCPVCGEVLGSHGRVVKILIGEYPLYLCGEECLPAVRHDPRRFLPRPLNRPAPGVCRVSLDRERPLLDIQGTMSTKLSSRDAKTMKRLKDLADGVVQAADRTRCDPHARYSRPDALERPLQPEERFIEMGGNKPPPALQPLAGQELHANDAGGQRRQKLHRPGQDDQHPRSLLHDQAHHRRHEGRDLQRPGRIAIR